MEGQATNGRRLIAAGKMGPVAATADPVGSAPAGAVDAGATIEASGESAEIMASTEDPVAAEMRRLRSEAIAAEGRAYDMERTAFALALWSDEGDPVRTELAIRRIADNQDDARERARYIRAADLIRAALGERMARQRAEREQRWRDLEGLREAQGAGKEASHG